jgi:hypothetical protein
MSLKKILKLGLCVLAIFGLHHFCQKQTHGFRPYLIMSNLPNEPRWEVPPLSVEEQEKIERLLDQPFTFLGSGGWCFAFLGADQKTVLKFYRHTHLQPASILKNFAYKKLLLQSDPLPQNKKYFQTFNFNSLMLLYTEAKERTGILYVHLNKTSAKHKPVTLIDNIGTRHVIDLDKTEFIVQKRAELLFARLQELSDQKKMDEAKQCIDDFMNCLLTLCQKGIRDNDASLRYNFGFTEDGAVTLDLSSFEYDETLKSPGQYRKEIMNKTQRLSRYLRKYHPELYAHSEKRLSEIMAD